MHNSAARSTLGIPRLREFRRSATLLMLTLNFVMSRSLDGSGLGHRWSWRRAKGIRGLHDSAFWIAEALAMRPRESGDKRRLPYRLDRAAPPWCHRQAGPRRERRPLPPDRPP